MIIVDFSQVFISSLLGHAGNHADAVEVNLVRHMVLNSLRSYRKKFTNKFGELVIAIDGQNYWRKDIFPQYKAHRKTDREKSKLDWNVIYQHLNCVIDDLKTYFPYSVIHIPGIEADDVIGTLVENYSQQPILVLSGDHDFIQLQQYGVTQYSPIQKKYIKTRDAKRDLYKKIIQGDRGDGIPNILSADNSFTEGIRQKKLTKKKTTEWLDDPRLYLDPQQVFDESVYRNFQRNQQLIDLSYIPDEQKKLIMAEFDSQQEKAGNRSRIQTYMIKNRMKNMMANINDF